MTIRRVGDWDCNMLIRVVNKGWDEVGVWFLKTLKRANWRSLVGGKGVKTKKKSAGKEEPRPWIQGNGKKTQNTKPFNIIVNTLKNSFICLSSKHCLCAQYNKYLKNCIHIKTLVLPAEFLSIYLYFHFNIFKLSFSKSLSIGICTCKPITTTYKH